MKTSSIRNLNILARNPTITFFRRKTNLVYHVLNQSFLSSKKLKSFKIIRKMSSLAYELKLSDFMKNHSIISVIHLKQAKKDSFERTVLTTSSSLTENDEKMFVIEKILKKRSLNNTNELLVK